MDSNIRSHRRLEVWKESMALVKEIYNITSSFPKEELFGLTSQLRRTSISIPSNIAEGVGRNSKKELLNFLYIARGSLCELETQLLIAKELSYIKNEDIFNRLEKIFALITGFINRVRCDLENV